MVPGPMGTTLGYDCTMADPCWKIMLGDGGSNMAHDEAWMVVVMHGGGRYMFWAKHGNGWCCYKKGPIVAHKRRTNFCATGLKGSKGVGQGGGDARRRPPRGWGTLLVKCPMPPDT